MKTLLCASTALALSAALATPAMAQVNGIGVSDPAIVVASSQALQTSYAQIATTFATQRTQLDQLQQQRDTLMRPFDTDGDGQLNEIEQAAVQANATALQQVQAVEVQLAQVQQPITAARAYAIEQISQQLGAAVQQVVAANNVSLVVAPNVVVWMAEAVDLTDEIAAALNGLVPTVSTTPPQGWQPQRSTVDLYQQVQQILLAAAVQQAQQQQAQPPAAAPAQGR